MATPRDPDPLAVVDPGRNIDRQLDALHLAPAAAAVVTRRLGDATVAAAAIARGRLHDLSQRRAQHRAQLAGALHFGQVSIGVPGSAPLPWQTSQQHDRLVGDVDRGAGDDLRSVISAETATSPPWMAPPGSPKPPPKIEPKPPPPWPKNASKMSETDPKPSKLGDWPPRRSPSWP